MFLMSSEESEDDIDVREARTLVGKINRKKRKAGGFQSMGLSQFVFNGITRKGYKIPTPIQRKVIPVILSGRDLVAMARTGSGKTAAFLIPILERLNNHQDNGARALLLSPTRELAMQTLEFTKELGKFTSLVAAVIVGGDRMDDQFMAIHQNPDIIIATPGRLLHVIMEMNMTLKSIEYVVFDEGDRLFEMGFADQLSETLHRLPSKRQTLIFSATLPGVLLEFARAGLSDPALIRLDLDSKLSNLLKMAFVSCLSYEKESLLIHILKTVIPYNERVVIFFATKHHVDYTQMLLDEFQIPCAVVHSGLDPVARVMSVQNFKAGRVKCLLVTDLAARGIDIPLLDNVVNFHFPGQPKLFVHRVGRVARAGRTGLAISLIDSDELPYLLDLFVFLGRQIQTECIVPCEGLSGDPKWDWSNELLATFPRNAISVVKESINIKEKDVATLAAASPVCKRALSKYMQTRPRASAESVRRAKIIRGELSSLKIHPLFASQMDTVDTQKETILQVLRNRKLPTIFEALGRHANPAAFETMTQKRKFHDPLILKTAEKIIKKQKKLEIEEPNIDEIAPQSGSGFFVPYVRGDEASERGLSAVCQSEVGFNFSVSAEAASFDVQGDEVGISHGRPAGTKKSLQVWDRKRKRFVNSDVAAGKANVARIKTESGVFIPASYKTDKYEIWLKRSKAYMDNTSGNAEDKLPDTQSSKETLKDPRKPKVPFANLFNAKYGSVVEFMDLDETPDRKRASRRERQNKAKVNSLKVDKPLSGLRQQSFGNGVKVVGTISQFARNSRNRAERESLQSKQNIRQPKGSRTFGQMRKPEQILKQRRRKDKQNSFKNKNTPHRGSGGVRGGGRGGGGRGGGGRGGGGGSRGGGSGRRGGGRGRGKPSRHK